MHTHTQTHTRHRCVHTQTHTHTHTPVGNQGNETEEKVFKKRKVFQEDLKELTEVEWKTETELFQIISRECGHFTMTKEKKKLVY